MESADVTFGCMPRDGGHLIVSPDQYPSIASDPVAAKYLRRYVGGRELLHGVRRWCLWMVDLDPADLGRSNILTQRIEAVRRERLTSKAASTKQAASTPHLFVQRAQPTVDYLCIPAVVSETRRFYPAARMTADVISSNKNFTAPDPDGFLFAIISSSMFITWQKTVGGRMKSDLNFANTITWNNFPFPTVSSGDRRQIIEAGKGVLAARELHPEKSLSAHYEPYAMTDELQAAHRKLDGFVDKAFGINKSEPTLRDRQAILFRRYEELTSPLFGSAPYGRRRK
jgi:hypothetical protein